MGSLAILLSNFSSLISFLFPFLEKFPSNKLLGKLPSKNLLPVQFEDMVSLVSRTGRHLQRYDRDCRLVVGCIPYRYRKTNQPSSIDGTCFEELEVLLVSSQKGHAMMFPKGGWEIDETMEQAALRETQEEAGVIGNVGDRLGKWKYMSKRGGIMHEGYMFPLLVQKQYDTWPEKNIRKRRWATVKEAREVCQQLWMREALDELVRRQTYQQQQRQKRGN